MTYATSKLPEVRRSIETLMEKFYAKPAQCSEEELSVIEAYFEEYCQYRNIYFRVFGDDPVGFTLESKLDVIKFYKKRLKNIS